MDEQNIHHQTEVERGKEVQEVKIELPQTIDLLGNMKASTVFNQVQVNNTFENPFLPLLIRV